MNNPPGNPPTPPRAGIDEPLPGIKHAVIPDAAERNPYRELSVGQAMKAVDQEGATDLRARGFDGDAMDSLMRSRWIEGMRIGRTEGHRAAAANYPDVYDEGFRAAAGEFYGKGFEAVAGALRDIDGRLDRVRALLQGEAETAGESPSDAALGLVVEVMKLIELSLSEA